MPERSYRAKVTTAPPDNGMSSILGYSSKLGYREDATVTSKPT